MPSTVIDRVKFIGRHEPSILTFTNWHYQDIGENPQDADFAGNEDFESIVACPTETEECTRWLMAITSQEWTKTLLSSPQE
jgi:hypothetical protein